MDVSFYGMFRSETLNLNLTTLFLFILYLEIIGYHSKPLSKSNKHGIPNATPLPRPDSIPNHLLLQPNNSTQLKPQLSQSEFKIIGKNYYRALLELFGGGPEICRPVVEGKVVVMDVWYLEGNLCGKIFYRFVLYLVCQNLL